MTEGQNVYGGDGVYTGKAEKLDKSSKQKDYVDVSEETKKKIFNQRSSSFDMNKPKMLSSADYERKVIKEKEIDEEIKVDVPYVKRQTVSTAVPQVVYPEELLVHSPVFEEIDQVEEDNSANVGNNGVKIRKVKDLYEHDPTKETIIEIPHIQQRIRNNVIPSYEEDPLLIDVPLVQIRPVPKEYIVDRNIPIPVEISIVQEIQCPRLVPVYNDIPLPVHVTRVTEKPVPKDALVSDSVLKAAISYGDDDIGRRNPNLANAPPNFDQIMEQDPKSMESLTSMTNSLESVF